MWNGRMAYESFEAKHGKYLYYREGSKYLDVDWKVSGPRLKVRGPYIELINHQQNLSKIEKSKDFKTKVELNFPELLFWQSSEPK